MEYNAPNTRERVAALRQRRREGASRPTSVRWHATRPGLRRVLLAWLHSGRVVSLVIFLVACGLLGYLFGHSRFQLQTITVEGHSSLLAEDVAAIADLRGRSIWFIDHEQTMARLSENAYIVAAELELHLPDHALIRVVERRPELRWQAGGVQYLVDSTGQVLGPAQEVAEGDVLVITDLTHAQLSPRMQLDSDAIRLAQALAVRLPVELGLNPTEIGWDHGLGVYIRTLEGQTIIFGQHDRLDRKLAILAALRSDQTPFTYLDLRPSNPFYQTNAR